MPPSAILCVRLLQDPLPRAVRWHQRELRPSSLWEQAVHASLESLARQAARPAREAVPANAQAIWFADHAELLACLARDWCEGRITTHWWWQGLFNVTEPNDVILREWQKLPVYVPAALQQLATWEITVPFIRTWDKASLRTLLSTVVHSFSLDELSPLLMAHLVEPDPTISQYESNDRAEDRPARFATRDTLPAFLDAPRLPLYTPHSLHSVRRAYRTPPYAPVFVPPWAAWVPETLNSGLELVQQLVLAVGLMLQRAPLVVRSPAFAKAVQGWMQTALLPPVTSDADTFVTAVSSPTFARPVIAQETAEGKLSNHDRRRVSHKATTEESRPTGGNEIQTKVGATPSVTPMLVGITPESTGVGIPQALSEEHLLSREVTRPAEVLGLEQTREATQRDMRTIETAFGGVFYLVNLGLFVGLYGDFTSPLRPGISLPLWDFVALVGRELIGNQLEDDPVWALLAELAGRTNGEEPGEKFTPTEQILQALLDAVIVPPFTMPSLDQVQDGLSRERKGDAWLAQFMTALRMRLQQALGLTEKDELATVLCRQWARVTVTQTHVDVSLSLAALPIAIRLAGLDRDPGWVPAAGRFLAFHFN